MADNGKERSDWDIVSLSSSSTYTERGLSESLFIFPPNEHENLPIVEPQNSNDSHEEENEILEENIEYQEPKGVQFYDEGMRVIYGSDESESDNHLERENDSDEGENNKELNLPCEAWWKKNALYLYKNAKEANKIWSILFASTLLGLVILGHRWHKEKSEINSRWTINLNNERISRILSHTRN